MFRKQKIVPFAIPVIILMLVIVYYYIDPSDKIWMPKCPWKLLTGTDCPSCGIQRFLHHLMKGDLLGALKLNPFLALALPYAILLVIVQWYNFNHRLDGLKKILLSRGMAFTYLFIYCSWWIIRNILHI